MFTKIQEIIADALYVEVDQVNRESNLMRDLGAESIDFLDIIFRLEKGFKVKIPRGEIERRARGNLSHDEFAINGKLTLRGLQQVSWAMPEVEEAELAEGLFVRDIPSLFTVATFERLVAEQLALRSKTPKPAPAGELRLDAV